MDVQPVSSLIIRAFSPKMSRGPAWCPYCLLHLRSPTPGCTLVKKCPAGCLLQCKAPCLHLLSPTACSIYYGTTTKPKQATAGQNELTSCLRSIQPLSGGTTHAMPELQQVWAVLDSLAVTAGIRTERCSSSFFGYLCCITWGARQYTKQYVQHENTHLGP